MEISWVVVAGAFLFASFIKGTTGMGFPLIATPMVALVVDLRTTYALLVLPNIVMDALQTMRGEVPWSLWRRLAPLLAATAVGTFLGTRILLAVPDRVVYLVLAGMLFLFLAGQYLRVAPRLPARWSRSVGAAVGLVGGILNGVTNIFGPIAAMYLLALEYEKRDFVKGVASIFLAAKISQLAAISRWGLYTGQILQWSVGLTAVALSAFWWGLRVQDRVPQETFARVLHFLLLGMAVFFAYRGLR